MKFGLSHFFAVIALILIGFGSIYSRHGFLDLRRIQEQIEKTKARIVEVELENQKLQRQVSLLEKPTNDLAEREVRDFLGWVKPNEMVYLERNLTP